jgi:hypothetical protein
MGGAVEGTRGIWEAAPAAKSGFPNRLPANALRAMRAFLNPLDPRLVYNDARFDPDSAQ